MHLFHIWKLLLEGVIFFPFLMETNYQKLYIFENGVRIYLDQNL